MLCCHMFSCLPHTNITCTACLPDESCCQPILHSCSSQQNSFLRQCMERIPFFNSVYTRQWPDFNSSLVKLSPISAHGQVISSRDFMFTISPCPKRNVLSLETLADTLLAGDIYVIRVYVSVCLSPASGSTFTAGQGWEFCSDLDMNYKLLCGWCHFKSGALV